MYQNQGGIALKLLTSRLFLGHKIVAQVGLIQWYWHQILTSLPSYCTTAVCWSCLGYPIIGTNVTYSRLVGHDVDQVNERFNTTSYETPIYTWHIDGLVQDCSNSAANILELL